MSSLSFGDTIWYAAIITSTIAFLFALNKKLTSIYLIIIFALLYISLVCSTLNLYSIYIKKSFHPTVGLFYRYAELWVLFFLYWIELVGIYNRRLLFGLLIVSTITLSLLIVDADFIRPFNATLFLVSSILLYWQWIKKMPSKDILRFKLFWINSGIFIYFSGSFFLFLSLDYLKANHYSELPYIWSLSNAFAIVKNAFFAYAFTLITKSKIKLC